MQVRINSEELGALEGLPFFVRCVYLLALRPYMDYATGLVGESRRVSWQSMAEALYVEPHQGVTDSGTPSKARIRRAVESLEKQGVIRSQGDGKRLVFWCVYADTDASAHEKPGKNPAQTRHSKPGTESGTPQAPSHKDSSGEPGRESGTNPTYPETEKPGKPPESGIRERGSPPDGGSPSRARVIGLPLNDGSEWGVTEDKRDEWQELYPAVDVDQALRAMRAWLIENPTRRKTRRGIGRFAANWLERDQNSGRNRRGNVTPHPRAGNRQEAQEQRNREVAQQWVPPELREKEG